jgi:galactoside O-acetyltransferase
MTEKEKAQAGLLYNANYDPTLTTERLACMDKCYDYNQLRPSQKQERDALLRNLLGKAGKNLCIEQPFYCDYGRNIEVGDNFFMGVNGVILDGAKVTFGNNVFVAPNCGFYTAGHPFNPTQRNEGLEYAYPISIGDNVWIGAGVSIVPGVTIGSNSVIGAGSVVTRNIPEGVLAVGNPCRVMKRIVESETI